MNNITPIEALITDTVQKFETDLCRAVAKAYPSPYLAVIAPPDGEPVEVALKEELRNRAEEPPPEEGPVFEPSLIRPLGEINGQLVVRCALQFFQRSFTDTTGELCFFEDHSPVYALMAPEDYFASRPVFREFSSIPNNGEV